MPVSFASSLANSSPVARRSVGFCEGVSTRCRPSAAVAGATVLSASVQKASAVSARAIIGAECTIACAQRTTPSALALAGLRLGPGRIRVVSLDRVDRLRRLGSEVFLIHDAILVHDERHDARGAVQGRVCDECEPADHVALDDEIVRAARRVGTLREEDAIEVAVIWGGSAAWRQRIAGGPCPGNERTERALLLTGLRFPVEAVVLALGTLEPLRVREKPGASRIVFALCVDVGQTHLDGRELVLPDPAIEQLVVACGG